MNVFLAALVVLLVPAVFCRTPCAPRSFGKDSVVCVCNATRCDDFDPIQKLPSGQLALYETSRAGARFDDKQLKWGENHAASSPRQQTITVNRNNKQQTILGFGGSFTDATGYMISQLPQELQDHIINDFFSEKGLEFNLNRLPIGGADFSRRAYSYDDGHDGDLNLTNFALQPEDRQYKIPYMKKAKQVSKTPQRFFGSPWSAPAWMKTNNEINHGGWLKGNPGEPYYKAFANYFVKFLNAYKAEGLDMWGVTIENEPSAGKNPSYGFNSMGFTKEIERDFIRKDLGPTLQAAGYGPDKLNVMIFDDQRDAIADWAQTIYSDPDAVKYVAGIAFHWYVNRPDNLGNLAKTQKVNPNKFILSTESSIGGVPSLGNWWNLESITKDVITDLNNYVAGWVGWNMVLDQAGGPNWAKLTADAPVIANPDKKEYYKQPDFYGHAHFSKFIAPGSVRLVHTETLNADNVLTTVALRPDGGVVVVALNTADQAVDYTIKDGERTIVNQLKGHTIQTYLYY